MRDEDENEVYSYTKINTYSLDYIEDCFVYLSLCSFLILLWSLVVAGPTYILVSSQNSAN